MRRPILQVVLSSLPALALAGAAAAQPASVAAVTQDDVFVRSGPAEQYYPFGRLKAGELLRLDGEKNGYARVLAMGPAFERMSGYVRYLALDAAARLEVAADGRRGLARGPLSILAPNLNSQGNPSDSWKSLATLPTGATLTIRRTTRLDGEIVQEVALPPQAVGWVNVAHLRPATAEEMRRWDSTVTEPAPALGRAEQTPSLLDPFVGPPAPSWALAGAVPGAAPGAAPAVAAAAGGPATGAPEAVQPRPAARSSERQRELEQLEGAYARLLEQPAGVAEALPLRSMYLEFAQRCGPEESRLEKFAQTRAQQLQIWSEAQERAQRLDEIKERLSRTAEETELVRLTLQRSGDYAAVGRLVASTIYDGRSLPRMLRIQEPNTGRTVAYVRPGGDYDLTTLIDQLIGVVGEKRYDGRLRLNVIDPVLHIDLLAPATEEPKQAPADEG
jgi:hypothetical protein